MYHQLDPRFALFVDDDASTQRTWLLDGFIRFLRQSPPTPSSSDASAGRARGRRGQAEKDPFLRVACASSAYSIDADLLHTALREAQRLLYTSLPDTPPWPGLPLWIE
jgi:hypothetical protein